ncbi:MAG: hypothetical protein L6Q35_15905, partial [Phycisphaerales bacterium]|nr:hypothetical protein [Phycisphaerales bacterium]
AASDINGVFAAGSTNNLIGDAGSAGGLTNGVSGNIVGVDPLLGSLANNGGPTQTQALLAGSPAINKGSNPDGLSTDQRGAGFARTQGTVADIGAYEIPVNPTLTSLTLSPKNVIIGQSVTLTANGAADSDGTISSVKFYRDDDDDGIADSTELLGTDSSAAGGYKWTDSSTSTYSPGVVRYLAVAVDNNANRSAAYETTATFAVPASPMIVSVVADVNNGNFSSADLSLREAISIANNYPGPDAITFSSSLSGQFLPLAGSPLTVTDSVTITGLGRSNLYISGEFQSSVFNFVSGASTLSGLAVTSGEGDWGGISNSGTLTISDLWVFSNTGDDGGGLCNLPGGTLTVIDSLIAGNSAISGGGIRNWGHLTISRSTVETNTASSAGGGIHNTFGIMTMSNCAVIANNSLMSSGGGIHGLGAGSAVYNSTIAFNGASHQGGGISGSFGSIYNSTIASNFSGILGAGIEGPSFFVESTLISGNSSGGVPWDVFDPLHGSSRNNLIQDAAHAGGLQNGVNGNLVGVDPMLSALGNHGGPTQAFDLLPGSPAIGAGSNTRNLATDQRGPGFARTAGFATDIGSFEFSPRPVSSVNPLAPTTGSTTFPVSWAGTTDADELPIASYSVYVSVNGGPYTAWLTDTAATSGQFTGLWGRTYSFYSVAKDGQGYVEDQLALPDASTFVGLPGITYWDGDALDRSWENPLNWSGDAIPGVGSDIVVDDPSAPAILHSSGTTVLHTFTSNAPLTILGGSLLVTQDAQITGSVTISAGSLQLDRTASITGTLTNSGVLGLSSTASLEVDGDFVQTAGATLELGARGSKAGTFAHVDVSGTASLAGTFAMSFEAATPLLPVGGAMDVISAGSLSGSFEDAVFLDRFGRETSRFHLEYVDGRVEVVMGPIGLPHR